MRTLRAELAFTADGRGLAVWTAGTHELHARAIREGELGSLVTGIQLDHGIGLGALAPAGERGFIAVATQPICNRYGSACLRARALGLDGAALGPPHEPDPRDQWDSITAQARVPDGLVIAYMPRWSSNIEIFRIGDDGAIARESHPLRAECTGDSPIHALAADGTSVVAFGQSCMAPPSQRFVLALGGRRQPVYALPESAQVERFTVAGGVATVVFRTGSLRARLVRVAVEDGRVVEGPIVLESGSLPADVAAVVVPELVTQRGRLMLRRADVAGAVVGPPIEIARVGPRAVSRLAWSGGRFHVLYATREGRTWTIRMRAVSCGTE